MKIAFEPERHVIRSWRSGREIAATRMKGAYAEQYGAGYFGAHRADLHALLAAALPPNSIRLGAECIGADNRGDKAVVILSDGTEVEGDVLIGADGIHSAIRTSVFGQENPRFTGNMCWRGLVPTKALPKDMFRPDMTVWFGPQSNIVHYYVRGGELINWVASHETESWTFESWRAEASTAEVLEAYEQWHPDLHHLFRNTEKCYKWALYDRSPMAQWTNGRITLLGDAAHAMLPYLAQGACMAIEDAYVLAQALNASDIDVEVRLRAYEEVRRPRTADVQLLAQARSKINNLTSPMARLARDLKYAWHKLVSPKRHAYQIEWIYGHDVTIPQEV